MVNARNKIKFTSRQSINPNSTYSSLQGNCALKGLQGWYLWQKSHLFIDNRVAKIRHLYTVCQSRPSLPLFQLHHIIFCLYLTSSVCLSEILLSRGGGWTGPDWAALIKNKVTIILDDKDNIPPGGRIRVPDSFVIVGAAHNFVSHKGFYKKQRARRGWA